MAVLFANNNSLSAITALPSGVSGGAMTLLSTQTASSDSTLSFTSGIDSTYNEYVFKCINIHLGTSTANNDLKFNFSIDGGSNYNVTKTTSSFTAYNPEGGGTANLGYRAPGDQAQSTAFHDTSPEGTFGVENDECATIIMHLFAPSSTTFVKHFMLQTQIYESGDYSESAFIAGYCNTTSAVDAVQFKPASGNIDSGVIKLYGVS